MAQHEDDKVDSTVNCCSAKQAYRYLCPGCCVINPGHVSRCTLRRMHAVGVTLQAPSWSLCSQAHQPRHTPLSLTRSRRPLWLAWCALVAFSCRAFSRAPAAAAMQEELPELNKRSLAIFSQCICSGLQPHHPACQDSHRRDSTPYVHFAQHFYPAQQGAHSSTNPDCRYHSPLVNLCTLSCPSSVRCTCRSGASRCLWQPTRQQARRWWLSTPLPWHSGTSSESSTPAPSRHSPTRSSGVLIMTLQR
jgi:hypothetical protein